MLCTVLCADCRASNLHAHPAAHARVASCSFNGLTRSYSYVLVALCTMLRCSQTAGLATTPASGHKQVHADSPPAVWTDLHTALRGVTHHARTGAGASGGGAGEAVARVPGDLSVGLGGPGVGVVAVHACGGLTDVCLDIAMQLRAPVAAMPCCYTGEWGTHTHTHTHTQFVMRLYCFDLCCSTVEPLLRTGSKTDCGVCVCVCVCVFRYVQGVATRCKTYPRQGARCRHY